MALSTICGPDDVVTGWSIEDEALRRQLGCRARNCLIPAEYRPLGWQLRQLVGVRKSIVGLHYYSHMPASKVRKCMDPALFDAYRKVTIIRNPWDREVSRYFWKFRNSNARPSFDRYIRWPRFRPQRKSFDLYSIDGAAVADTILRYESLEDDLENFLRSIGIEQSIELPRAKSVFRPKTARDYRNFYSDETRDLIAKRYALEIETFGYQF